MYLKIFGIILSFYITYPAIIFTNYVMLLYIFDLYVLYVLDTSGGRGGPCQFCPELLKNIHGENGQKGQNIGQNGQNIGQNGQNDKTVIELVITD